MRWRAETFHCNQADADLRRGLNRELDYMEQVIGGLEEKDLANLEAKRDWVRNHYEPHAIHKYADLQGKLSLLDAILANRWIEPEETLKLQCLGITFGDALAQHLKLEWVMVEDADGRDPALRLPGTSVLIFPQTMISKRIEDGQEVDVHELFNKTCSAVREAVADGA